MIGRLTEAAVHASELALTYEQLAWPQSPQRFAELRVEAVRLLGLLEVDVEVPLTQDAFLQERSAIGQAITQTLSAERGRILGDTVALPVFFLYSFALRAVINLSVGAADNAERDFVDDCLEDLGLDRGLSEVLDREAGWISLFPAEDGGEPGVRYVDIIRAGASFFVRMMEEFGRAEADTSDVLGELQALRTLVADFRAEQREANDRIEQLVRDGDMQLMEVLAQIEVALVGEGVEPAEAQRLVEDDPATLWGRILRWFGGSGPRDAAEAALWAALDFVPGGTGVKLGLKVTEAVRKSIKK